MSTSIGVEDVDQPQGPEQHRVAIVTGGTRSMGGTIAATLAASETRVACWGRSAEHGEAVVGRIRAAGGDALFVRADLTDESSVIEAMGRTVEHFGRLDVIVNNAAATDILRGDGGLPVVEETTERFDRMMKVNLYAPFWMAKYGIPHMIAGERGGSIVSISSITAHRAERSMPSYAASKAGLEGLTRQMAYDYAAHNIRVNAIVLGSTVTEETAYLHADPVAGAARRRNRMLEEPGSAQDVANLVQFLCSSSSRYMTAATVPLDGGAMATFPAPVISEAGRQPTVPPAGRPGGGQARSQ